MSTYTDIHCRVKENIAVDTHTRDTIQRVRLLNRGNEYWGTFYGTTILSQSVLSGATIIDSSLSSTSGTSFTVDEAIDALKRSHNAYIATDGLNLSCMHEDDYATIAQLFKDGVNVSVDEVKKNEVYQVIGTKSPVYYVEGLTCTKGDIFIVKNDIGIEEMTSADVRLLHFLGPYDVHDYTAGAGLALSGYEFSISPVVFADISSRVKQVEFDALNNHMKEVDASIESINEDIVAEEARATAAENKISTDLADAIANEAERADTAEQYLSGAIAIETAVRIANDDFLSGQIDAAVEAATAEIQRLDAKIDDEIERAKDSEEVLSGMVQDESARALTAEASLQASIEAEAKRADDAEQYLSGRIDDEIARAIAAEDKISTDLADAIADEAKRADVAEQVISAALTDEVNRATAAEVELQANIDALSAYADEIFETKVDANNKYNDLTVQISAEQCNRQLEDIAIREDMTLSVSNLSSEFSLKRDKTDLLTYEVKTISSYWTYVEDEAQYTLKYAGTGDAGVSMYYRWIAVNAPKSIDLRYNPRYGTLKNASTQTEITIVKDKDPTSIDPDVNDLSGPYELDNAIFSFTPAKVDSIAPDNDHLARSSELSALSAVYSTRISQVESKVSSLSTYSEIHSELSNDGYLTEHQSLSDYYKKSETSSDTEIAQAIKPAYPSKESLSTQLAGAKGTYDFVNSSINAMAAFYLTRDESGNAFSSYADLSNAIEQSAFYNAGQKKTPVKNDYCVVLEDETQVTQLSTHPTTRYTYQGTWPDGQFNLQYIVNNTPLTQAQVDAINSTVTKAKVDQIDTNAGIITTLQNDVADLDNSKADKSEILDWALSADVNTNFLKKAEASNTYATKTELSSKLDKTYVIDPLSASLPGYAADALKTKQALATKQETLSFQQLSNISAVPSKADKSLTYTKTEVDTALSAKRDKTDFFVSEGEWDFGVFKTSAPGAVFRMLEEGALAPRLEYDEFGSGYFATAAEGTFGTSPDGRKTFTATSCASRFYGLAGTVLYKSSDVYIAKTTDIPDVTDPASATSSGKAADALAVKNAIKLNPVFSEWDVRSKGAYELRGFTQPELTDIGWAWRVEVRGGSPAEDWTWLDDYESSSSGTNSIYASGMYTEASRSVDHYTLGDRTEKLLAGARADLNIPTLVVPSESATDTQAAKAKSTWSLIWGALTALPAGFTSLYDWCVSQFAGKLDKGGGEMTMPIYGGYKVNFIGGTNGANDGIAIVDSVGNAVVMIGVQNGQLCIIAPHIYGDTAVHSNKFDVGGGDTTLEFGKLTQAGSDLWLPSKSGTLALLSDIIARIAPAYSASSTYEVGEIVSYNETAYKCKTAITTPEAWNSEHWETATEADGAARLSGLKSDGNVTNVFATNLLGKPVSQNIISTIVDAQVSSKVVVEDKIEMSSYSSLSVVKMSRDEYELSVASGVDLSGNVLYLLEADDINAYGQQIKNVAQPVDADDAATKSYVDTNSAKNKTIVACLSSLFERDGHPVELDAVQLGDVVSALSALYVAMK